MVIHGARINKAALSQQGGHGLDRGRNGGYHVGFEHTRKVQESMVNVEFKR